MMTSPRHLCNVGEQ